MAQALCKIDSIIYRCTIWKLSSINCIKVSWAHGQKLCHVSAWSKLFIALARKARDSFPLNSILYCIRLIHVYTWWLSPSILDSCTYESSFAARASAMFVCFENEAVFLRSAIDNLYVPCLSVAQITNRFSMRCAVIAVYFVSDRVKSRPDGNSNTNILALLVILQEVVEWYIWELTHREQIV